MWTLYRKKGQRVDSKGAFLWPQDWWEKNRCGKRHSIGCVWWYAVSFKRKEFLILKPTFSSALNKKGPRFLSFRQMGNSPPGCGLNRIFWIVISDAGTGGRGDTGPSIFWRSVNTIQTKEGRLAPPITTGPPIFFTFRHHWLCMHVSKVVAHHDEDTVKSWAVDWSNIPFLRIFGVLLTEMCYWPRVTIYIEGLLFNFWTFGGATT